MNRDKRERRFIMFWPIYFPVLVIVFTYLGIGNFLHKISNWLLDKAVK